MIYGKNFKGNYRKFFQLVKKLPVFPEIDNQPGMLHRNSSCELVRLIMDHEEAGLFFPQNRDYVKTSDMVKP